VKIVDANVLLYAVNRASAEHQPAHRWMTSALSGNEGVGLPWVSLLAFIRLSTSRRIFASPLSPADAMTVVESWLAQPAAVTVEPTTRHSSVLRGLLEQAGTAGNLTTDAHIAALAIEHGATVVTFDRDFERFDIRVRVPT
jgi:toxin-antitoxin system PIN domain toxin